MAVEIDRVIAGYLHLRAQKEQMGQRHKEELAPLNLKMEQIENYVAAQLNTQGLTNFSAKGTGVAFFETRTEAKITDWDAAFAWITSGKHWEFLEKRVSKTVVKDYVEAHGEVPPGIGIEQERVVRIRKS